MFDIHHALTTSTRADDARVLVLEYLLATHVEVTGDPAAPLPEFLRWCGRRARRSSGCTPARQREAGWAGR